MLRENHNKKNQYVSTTQHDAIVVWAGKLRKLWDCVSELRSCLCERRLERTFLRPALLPVKTVQFTQFFRQVWRHTVKSLFDWGCTEPLKGIISTKDLNISLQCSSQTATQTSFCVSWIQSSSSRPGSLTTHLWCTKDATCGNFAKLFPTKLSQAFLFWILNMKIVLAGGEIDSQISLGSSPPLCSTNRLECSACSCLTQLISFDGIGVFTFTT